MSDERKQPDAPAVEPQPAAGESGPATVTGRRPFKEIAEALLALRERQKIIEETVLTLHAELSKLGHAFEAHQLILEAIQRLLGIQLGTAPVVN